MVMHVLHVKDNMNIIEEIYDNINKHIASNKACHVPLAIRPVEWDIVLNHLQQCADGKYTGGAEGVLVFKLEQAEEIPEIKLVMDSLNEQLNLKVFDAKIFTSFTTKREQKTKQAVHSNTLLWSLTGNMKVNLYPTMAYNEDPFYSEVFEKGDLIFIPADMPHEIEPIGANAMVSFGIEVEPGTKYNLETKGNKDESKEESK